MSRWRVRLSASIGTASLLLLSFGCSSGEEATEVGRGVVAAVTPAPVKSIPDIDSTADLALPIEAYMLSDKQSALIDRARQTLIQSCMQRFGFAYSIPVVPPPRDASLVERRYGIADSTVAAEWGYHSPDSAQRHMRQGPVTADSQTPAELTVLTGWPGGKVLPGQTPPAVGQVADEQIPVGGCQGEAIRLITGDDDENYGDDVLVQAINQSTESDSDKRVRDAIGKWSECMKRAGYDYPGPLEAVDSFGGPTPTEIERKTAVTDVECKSETNLIGVWFTVETAYQTAAIKQNLERLTSVKRRLETMIRNAASIAGDAAASSADAPQPR